MPWGMSESAFDARDIELHYQYSGFGVPGLGLKRGLSEDLVIAPYATALAALVDPSAAVAQSRAALRQTGARDPTGFMNRSTTPAPGCRRAQKDAVVRAYMAHHQGMSLVALCERSNRQRHARSLSCRADREGHRTAPAGAHAAQRAGDAAPGRRGLRGARCAISFRPAFAGLPHRTIPHRAPHLLSNGRYAVMLTSAGSGYSRWRDIAITRWREDPTRDCLGLLHLPPRCTKRQRLVGGLSAARHRARFLRGRLL